MLKLIIPSRFTHSFAVLYTKNGGVIPFNSNPSFKTRVALRLGKRIIPMLVKECETDLKAEDLTAVYYKIEIDAPWFAGVMNVACKPKLVF